MDKSEYRKKQEDVDRKRREVAEASYRGEVIGALNSIAQQNQATENQAKRADTYHRRVEKLALRLEGRKFWLEVAETAGLWAAAAVGVAAIVVSNLDAEQQRTVMEAQQTAMQGQLVEMKAAGERTDQMVETNRRLAEAAAQQAQAAIDSAKTAQENMVAAQRAWVGPRNAKSSTGPELEKDLNIVIEYQNTGREPALETIFDVEVFVASKEEDVAGSVANRINNFTSKCKIKWNPNQRTVVFPSGSTASAYELASPLSANLIDQDVINGAKAIYIDGCFVYKSAGAIRRSSFCYSFIANKTKPSNWNVCLVGNEAD
jgi:hypothetical protein